MSGKCCPYGHLLTVITDLMKPYEDAYQQMLQKKNIDPAMVKIINELKSGDYETYSKIKEGGK